MKMSDKLRAAIAWKKGQEIIRKTEHMKGLCEKHGGEIVNDPQYGGAVVQISPYHCVTKNGVHIWEWP